MKNIRYEILGKVVRGICRGFVPAMIVGLACLFPVSLAAQNSFPAPGGGSSAPAPGTGGAFMPDSGPSWGGGYGPGWSNFNNFGPMGCMGSNWQNQGVVSVVGCGYDMRGIWRIVPMRVAYTYTYGQYDCTVLSAYNPWTEMWNRGLDQPAYNTIYWLRGNEYDFYANLPTGTYYFNL